MNISDSKKQVLEYAQRCMRQGLIAGTSGNLSLLSDAGEIVITPSGVDYMTMTEADIMVINLDGGILEGPHKPSSEWPMHAVVYKSDPAIRSIVHTHSPYATAFAVINEPIPVVLVEMVFFLGGDIRVAPLAVQGTEEVGLGCVEALKGRGACLLQNHGAVTVGKNLPQAFIRTEYAEDAAKIYHMAKAVGTPVHIPESMIQTLLNK